MNDAYVPPPDPAGATGEEETLRELTDWLTDDGEHRLASGVVPATAPKQEQRVRWISELASLRARLAKVTEDRDQWKALCNEYADKAEAHISFRARLAESERERAAVMQALGIEYDAEERTYVVLGKLAAVECDTLVEAARAAVEIPSAAWHRAALTPPEPT